MKLRLWWAFILTGLSGFIALGYEIVWARVYSFLTGSRGEAFGAMLGSYLLGLALGSVLSRRWQREPSESGDRLLTLARLLLGSNVVCFLVAPLVSWCVVKLPLAASHPLQTLILVAIGATWQGTLLPLLCHYAIPADQRAGFRVSLLYLANIIGSGAGSLLAGFLLIDRLGSGNTATLLLGAGLVAALALAWHSRAAKPGDWLACGTAALLASASPWLHGGLFQRLFFGREYHSGSRVEQLVETRQGVIIVDTNRVVYGGKVYDGVISTRLEPVSGLIRPYFVSALHPAPREVLVIGVSGGAWTQILAHNPGVERVTAIEINRGYLEVIRRHPEVASLLANPKVDIVIDDGRRWLQRHPQRAFDIIVMNTTFHWREFASGLLSKEFLEITRSHLKSGGQVMWNCTGSARAVRTGMEVFPHTMMIINNCVGSLQPLNIDRQRWRAVLEAYKIDGQPVFDLSTTEGRERLEKVLLYGLTNEAPNHRSFLRDRRQMEELFGGAQIITDDNLGHEYSSVLNGWMETLRLDF